MTFDPQDPRITAYVFGELAVEQREAFEAELAASPELQQAVQATRETVEQLAGELAEDPKPQLSGSQRGVVHAAIADRAGTDSEDPSVGSADSLPVTRSGRRRLWTLLALAASLLIVAGTFALGTWAGHEQARRQAELVLKQADRVEALRRVDHADALKLEELEGQRAALERALADVQGARHELVASGRDSALSADQASGERVALQQALAEREESRLGAEASERLRLLRSGGSESPSNSRAPNVSSASGAAGPAPIRTLERESAKPYSSSVPSEASAPAGSGTAAYGLGMDRSGTLAGPGAVATAPGQTAGNAAGSQPGSSGVDSLSTHYADGRGSVPGPRTAPAAEGYGYGGEYGEEAGYGYGAGGAYGGGYAPGYESFGDAEYGPASGRGAGRASTSTLETMPDGERQARPDLGSGPGWAGDRYASIVENAFQNVLDHPLSTFSIDVDTASYSKVRMYLLQHNTLPRPDAVRIEELVNYFTYDYAPPEDETPFAAHIEVAECPWQPDHRLVRFGIKGQEMERDERPTSNLVFLLDVSGSMNQPNKLPLVKHGMKMLVDQLGENDRVAIAVYAGAAGMVLDSTCGDRKAEIVGALDRLSAGGSTNGGQGIRLAYQLALDNFVTGGVNRVILCTDGDFNVGVTGTDQLVKIAEDNAKTGVFLSVLGFGMGNHNDSMLEQISNKGNGNYAFIDNEAEARKVLVEQLSGTLVTIAKDVKIQVEFNPQQVRAYRLIGYENRILAAEDFNDDTKDAGEIGAGHTVTALYEIVPGGADSEVSPPPVDELRYQRPSELTDAAESREILTLKIRYKQPDGDTSSLLTFPTEDSGHRFGQASKDFRFAASVAAFGMLLRNSQYAGGMAWAGLEEIATEAASDDASGYRDEFLQMVARARSLSGQ